ncbi:MAG: glycosyltransferase [Longimicrobiales bacterium]
MPSQAGVKVSVVVTTYNHERFAAQAVESVISQQTTFPYEVLLADDCSTDGTMQVLRRFERESSERVRVIVAERNRGDGGKRFFAEVLRLCKGEMVALLDGDDFWTAPDKLQVQADYLDAHRDFSLCFHDVKNVDETGTGELAREPAGTGNPVATIQDLLASCFIAACSPMFRTSVLVPVPEWYFEMPWGDWPLYLIAAAHGRIGHLDRVMGAYRIHGGGMWSGLDVVTQNRQVVEFYRTLLSVLDQRHHPLLRQMTSIRYNRLARAHLERREWREARRCALLALQAKPIGGHHDLKTLLGALLVPRVSSAR